MPALTLSIQGRADFDCLPARSTLIRWIKAAIARDSEFTLRFVGTGEGRRLNRDYRGKDMQPSADVRLFNSADGARRHRYLRPSAKARALILASGFDHWPIGRAATLHAHGHHHYSAVAARAVVAQERKILKSLGKRVPY